MKIKIIKDTKIDKNGEIVSVKKGSQHDLDAKQARTLIGINKAIEVDPAAKDKKD